MKPLVSINLLTWNGEKYIEKCLKSALGQTYDNIEINVLDNGSKDKTIALIKKIKKKSNKKINIRQNEENIGFAPGQNVLIRNSKGDFILMLNQDAILDKDYIKKALKEMEKDKKIAAIQPKIIKYDYDKNKATDSFDSAGLLIYRNRRIVNRGQGAKDKGQYEEKEEIFGADGAVPFYRSKALEDIKIDNEYFDESFFAYKEDVDLSWRLRLYGWKIVYVPSILAYHGRGAGEKAVRNYVSVALARRKISKFAKFYSFKNQRLVQIKNELLSLFFRDIFYILTKEIAAWIYVLVFERYTWKAIKALIKEIPGAWQKRKVITKRRRVGARKMKKWFI